MIGIMITVSIVLVLFLGLCRKDINCIKKQVDEIVRLQELGNPKPKQE